MAYAVDTKVPIAQTRTEIETLLKKRGATRIFHMDDDKEAIFGFFLDQRLIKVALPLPVAGPKADKVRRSRWRALAMIIRARLEAIEAGISTVEHEFMADIVMPDGQRVGDWLKPQLKLAFETGVMPTSPLMLQGPKS